LILVEEEPAEYFELSDTLSQFIDLIAQPNAAGSTGGYQLLRLTFDRPL